MRHKKPATEPESKLHKSPETESEEEAFVYLLRCEGGFLYTGITTDLRRRFAAHASGKGAKYTRAHKPLYVAAAFRVESLPVAGRFEYAIKHLSKEKKEGLVTEPERAASFLPVLAQFPAVPLSKEELDAVVFSREKV